MESVVDGNEGGSRLVMNELSRIKELVKQLDVHLGGCPDLCKDLSAQIFTVTERSIGMITSGHFDGLKRSTISAGLDSPSLSATPSSGVSDMPLKVNKKRKTMEKGKHQIRMSSAGGGAETPVDDGFRWRKYGQKEILGAQHPRGYYRCTNKKISGMRGDEAGAARRRRPDALRRDLPRRTHVRSQDGQSAAGDAEPGRAQPSAEPEFEPGGEHRGSHVRAPAINALQFILASGERPDAGGALPVLHAGELFRARRAPTSGVRARRCNGGGGHCFFPGRKRVVRPEL